MIVTNNIGILAAELKLTLLSSLKGQVIREHLRWELRGNDGKISTSHQAMALFSVTEGEYLIVAFYQNEELDLGQVKLLKNTRTDIVFVLAEGSIQSSEDYFCEYDAKSDFSRRQHERDLQSQFGFATLPLRNPDHPAGDLNSQIPAHPLLQDKVQFDGVPPDIRPDPSENREALQLTLAQRLAAAPAGAPSPSPLR